MYLSYIDLWRSEEAPLSLRISTREAVELTLIFDDEGREERRGMEMTLGTGALTDVAAALEEMAARLRRMAERRADRQEGDA